MQRPLRLLAGVLVALCTSTAGTAPVDLDLNQLCDPYTPLTLVGVDTEANRALFSMPSRQSQVPGWLVELRAGELEVFLYPDWRERRRFGGSVGPGPVLSVTRCGDDCLQLVTWSEGGWRDLGGPLTAPGNATVHPTRDGDGVPWLILHTPTGEPGVVTAEAWRLEGKRWLPEGRLPVAAVGSPAARAAAGGGVLSGSGRYRAGEPAVPWVNGLPGLAAGARGQLVPLPGDEVAYLARDGGLYLSVDGGASWRASRRPPWGEEGEGAAGGGGDSRWIPDLPVSDPSAPLAVAWFGGHDPERPQLRLGERPAGGPWRRLARLPASELLDGVEIGYSHLLRLADGRWLLLAGCEVAARGCALRLRVVNADGATLVHSLRLRPSWLEEPSDGD